MGTGYRIQEALSNKNVYTSNAILIGGPKLVRARFGKSSEQGDKAHNSLVDARLGLNHALSATYIYAAIRAQIASSKKSLCWSPRR